ncbi:hypothetical protein WJW27_002777 [Escherichia coli]|uniref:hypothetical protein n=1 Tax=Escherichia coli TaxID=562 RepID=UPI0023770F9C|nr:hypothetical protein vBEcoMphAPEC6_02785 [Escherichia phage ph0011]
MINKHFAVSKTVTIDNEWEITILNDTARGLLAENILQKYIDCESELIIHERTKFLLIGGKKCKVLVFTDKMTRADIITKLVSSSRHRPGVNRSIDEIKEMKPGDLFIVAGFDSKTRKMSISEMYTNAEMRNKFFSN